MTGKVACAQHNAADGEGRPEKLIFEVEHTTELTPRCFFFYLSCHIFTFT